MKKVVIAIIVILTIIVAGIAFYNMNCRVIYYSYDYLSNSHGPASEIEYKIYSSGNIKNIQNQN